MNTTLSTPSGKAAWVPDPSCRGNFGIASLCFSTTLICIWSSVHYDIPLERLPTFRSLLRDAPLVVVALVAPELMFHFALSLICARSLVHFASGLESFRVPMEEAQVGPQDRTLGVGNRPNDAFVSKFTKNVILSNFLFYSAKSTAKRNNS